MAAKGDVELIIRAKNEATKNLDKINSSLKELADQQTIVGDSAGKADDKLAQLGLELAKLRTNAQNLKALTTVGDVLDRATAAMQRQEQAAKEAAAEQDRLAQRQQELAAESTRLGAALKTATTEVNAQDKALKSAKGSLTDLSKESTRLANAEASLTGQLATAGTALEKRQAALDEARTKQAALTAAIAGSEKVTKAQQNSLDAANRSIERRQKAVDETIAKEAALRAEMERVRTAMAQNTAAALNANNALSQQAARVNEAQTAAAKLKVEADSLARAERDVVKDVKAATGAVDQQANALKEAQTEYAQVSAAAASARTAVAGSTVSTKAAGTEAGRAAVQVATFAARLAVLSGAGGQTSKPFLVNAAEIAKAEGAIAELGVTIRAAGNDASSASVSSNELTAALKGVGTAQAQLQGIGQALKNQQAAVDGAQKSWKEAEAEVRRLALAVKAADQPSDELAAALGKAQGAARLAKDEFLRQSQAAGQMGKAMQDAGLGSGSLASAEAALAPKIQRANELMNQGQTAASRLGAAVTTAGSSASSAAPGVSRMANALGALVSASNRVGSATNPLRLFKNELVAMVAAGAGLYAIKEQLQSIFEAGTQLASNTSKYATAFGSIEEGNKELAYAREVALNLKLPLGDLTKSYADLALAAKGGALEGEGARKVFEAFAQATRVNGGSADDLNGIFRALTQSMSKGKVQAEELRGQLGDRMPGAIQLMAQGLGVTTAKLDEMLEKGQLTSESLVNMAAAVSGRVAPQLTAALDSPAAKLADFQNRILIFKETVAGSGFLDAVADAFDRMAKALSTPEAIQAAKDLGQALADLVTWAVELATSGHLETILEWMKAFGIAWVGVQITSLITGFYGFAAATGVVAASVLGLEVALSPVLLGLGVLGGVIAAVAAAFGAWKLAEWVYDNVPAFAEGVMSIKNAALNAWDGILQMWEMTATRLKSSFTRVTSELANIWYGMLNTILNAFPDLTKSLGMGDYAADIAKRAADANAAVVNGEATMNAELDAIRERYAGKENERQRQLQEDIAKYHTDRIRASLTEEEKAAGAAGAASLMGKPGGLQFPGAPTAGPLAGTGLVTASPYVPDATKEREAEEKKAATRRLALEQSVANQMFAIRSQLEKKSAETTDEMVAAVPAKYAKLYGQLTALGKDRNSEEWKTVDALVAQEQANIRSAQAKKASVASAKAEREATEAETKSRKEGMEAVNTLLQTRKNIQEQLKRAQETGDVVAVESLKENLATVTAQLNDAINGMLTFWQAVGGPEADAAIAKLNAMKLTVSKVKEEGILTGNAIGKALGERLKSGVDSFIDKIAETGDVFGSLKDAFLDFARSFLTEIAKMILQQVLFNAVKAGLSAIGGGGSIGAGLGAALGAASNHTGGVVGRDSGPIKMLSISTIQNAVRYHGGGVAGLKSNEIPTVLEAGEVVRTEQQEKALAAKMDAATGPSGGAPAPQPITMINTIDTESFFAAGASSPAMQKTLMNLIRANKSSVKSILG